MLGQYLVYLTFTVSLLSTIFYWYVLQSKSIKFLNYARNLFYISVVGIIVFSSLLIYFIFTHQFQYNYIWGHSSTDLPLPLLFSTFYAGQEGSFNLWALFTGILGIPLLKYAIKRNYEIELMVVFGSIFSVLLLFLVVKNPFTFIWDVFPKELIGQGEIPSTVTKYIWLNQTEGIWAMVPVEGKGLNPLLQNYWMVIHPPILFIGFTAMSVPFSYAVAALIKRDFQSWIIIAKPWIIFGSMILGCGILLGGFWAYETLGWGGFWGWDPVENSSLVPWLVSVASLHTMVSQKNSQGFIRTNFILSILCFLLVLYSTFLTRSGILGETSVHSFVTPGAFIYWLLLGTILLFSTMGFGFLIKRWKEIPKPESTYSILSREYSLFLGASVLVISSFFILIGTSSPIITTLMKGKASAVEINYYIQTVLPLAIALGILSGLGQISWWKNTPIKTLSKKIILPVILSLIFTIVSYYFGATELAMLILLFSSFFMLSVNSIVLSKILKGKIYLAGSPITHIGFSIMLIGFITSAKYDSKRTISLEEGKTISALGYNLTYVGYEPLERNNYAFNILVNQGENNYTVSPIMFINKQDNNIIRHPDILNMLIKDFYVSPLSLEDGKAAGQEVDLVKNKVSTINGVSLKYSGYTFVQNPKTGNELTLSIEYKNKSLKEIINPKMLNMKGEVSYSSVKTKDGEFDISIISVNPAKSEEQTTAKILLTSLTSAQEPKKETLIVEATIKPLIILVWFGTAIVMLGYLISLFRRIKESH